MICPRCGANHAGDSNFCASCGLDLRPYQQAAQPSQKQEETFVYRPEETPSHNVDLKQEENRKKQRKEGEKKKPVWRFILIPVLVLLLGGAAFFILELRSTPASGEGAYYIYLSDGKYELLSSLEDKNPTELGSGVYGTYNGGMVTFTEDGTYVYYFTQVDYYGGTGTLCRAEYARLKGTSSKNNQYIQVIATNVDLDQCWILEDGRAVYLNPQGSLYQFDGTETAWIAGNVTAFYLDESKEGGRLAYEIRDDGGNALYCGSLYEPGTAQLLAQNYSYIDVYNGLDEILVANQDADWNSYLAIVSLDHAPIDLGQGYVPLMTQDGFYYIVNQGAAVSPYDYVEDSYAADDAGITVPEPEDYTIEVYAYQPLSYDSDLSSYSEIYTSCTQPLNFWQTSMENAVIQYASDPTIQSFVDTYGPQANEDGYIVVTNEIAAALQAMAETYGLHYDGEWPEFCFAYDVDGYIYDYDAFNQAVDAYNSVADRIQLREELQSGEYDIPLYALYLFREGASTLICDNALAWGVFGNVLLYNTPESVTPVGIEDLGSIWNIYDLFYLDIGKENYCIGAGQSTPVKLSLQAADSLSTAWNTGYAELSLLGDEMFLSESSGALAVATVSDGTVGAFGILTDNGVLAEVDPVEGCVYYGANVNDDQGDLFLWKDGVVTCLASDVVLSDLSIYEDGSILAYTDSDRFSYYYGRGLKLIRSDGAEEFIASQVTDFLRLESGDVLYISGDSLYIYDGRESVCLASQAENVWSNTAMLVSKNINSE